MLLKSFRNLALVASALAVTACGTLPGMRPVVAPGQGFDADAAANAPISVAFNDTYLERIELNQPLARKSATNTDKNLYKLIKGAKNSIDGAFYDIEDLGVTQAIIDAKKRGVVVRLVTDTDNMVEKADPTKPRVAIEALKGAGVPIVDDKRSAIMHHKFMVVDGQAVWTGSTNLTPTSLYCHNNNALTLRSPALAKVYDDEFERLFLRHEFGKSSRGGQTPEHDVVVGTAHIRVFFSPDGGGREAVVDALKHANKSVRLMTFSLTDAETGDTIVARAAAGVKVEGIFDRWLAAGAHSLFNRFKTAKLNVMKDGNEALMHHKVMIIDNETLITGSYNYSENAEENNNEAFMIISNAPSVVHAYTAEFSRLSYAAKHNHPPPFKRPDPEKKTGEGP